MGRAKGGALRDEELLATDDADHADNHMYATGGRAAQRPVAHGGRTDEDTSPHDPEARVFARVTSMPRGFAAPPVT